MRKIVIGGPDKPEVLTNIPLKNPANIEVNLSLLMVIVFPVKRNKAAIKIIIDIIIFKTYISKLESIIIPIGIPKIAEPAIGRILSGFKCCLFSMAIM